MKDNKNLNELILWSIVLVIMIILTILGKKFLKSKENVEIENTIIEQVEEKKEEPKKEETKEVNINEILGGKTLEEIQAELDEEYLQYQDDEGVE